MLPSPMLGRHQHGSLSLTHAQQRTSPHLLDDTQRATACSDSIDELIHLLLPVLALGLCMQNELHSHLLFGDVLQDLHQGCCMT